MNKTNCLSEQDLILYYYAELPDQELQTRHITNCPLCTENLAALRQDLAHLPELTHEADPFAESRMAARINERLHDRRRSWLPALGASAVAAFALVATVVLWPPQTQLEKPVRFATPSIATIDINDDMPDIDFLEDFELLKELELLSQIEGV